MNEVSKYQEAIYKAFQLTKKNLSISAVAGSGKTTTLLGLLNYIPRGASSLFLAFNNSIVDELRQRNTRDGVNIMTIHSCGWRMLLRTYGSKIKMNANKGMGKTEMVLKELKIPAARWGYYFYMILKMLDLLRCNLLDDSIDSIRYISDHYNIDIEEEDIKSIQLAYKYLNKDRSQFDFMDMIYVPVKDKLRFTKYDYVFCDESQDFSICQQTFIKNCINRSGRLVTVGDPNQAIYGFAGADADSYEKLAGINGATIKLPLSVSYRCAKNIVLEAQKIVPEIEYAADAEYGKVIECGSLTDLQQGDWILCRNLKPLIQTYLFLLRNKIKSKIKGKDIGEGIVALICKTGTSTIPALKDALEREKSSLFDKLERKGVHKPALHPKMELLEQRIEVIECLLEEVYSVKELLKLISNIFSDDIKGIMLSTIHKAKGLENDRVFFLAPELIPSKYATMDWEFIQESNLKYVAITRAKKELIYVPSDVFVNDLLAKVKI